MNELLICYFRDSLRPLIWFYFDKCNWKFNDWQELIERTIKIETKIVCWLTFAASESDIYYFRGHKSMKGDWKGKKDIEIKKTPHTSINYNGYGSGQSNQLDQNSD